MFDTHCLLPHWWLDNMTLNGSTPYGFTAPTPIKTLLRIKKSPGLLRSHFVELTTLTFCYISCLQPLWTLDHIECDLVAFGE